MDTCKNQGLYALLFERTSTVSSHSMN